MTLSNSRLSYTDCFEVFDRALEDPLGIRIPCQSLDIATHYRMRMHQARAIDRADNARTYEPGHPMHARSPYDELRVMLRQHGAQHYIYLVKNKTPTAIEPLSELEQLNGPNTGNLLEHLDARSVGGDRADNQDRRPEGVVERLVQIPLITRR